MKICESGWIDLKKTIEYITRGTICNTMENFENFVQEGLQNGFPQLYRYIYKDYRGNITIRPLYESKRAEITFMFADREEGNTHDEQKPD